MKKTISIRRQESKKKLPFSKKLLCLRYSRVVHPNSSNNVVQLYKMHTMLYIKNRLNERYKMLFIYYFQRLNFEFTKLTFNFFIKNPISKCNIH